MLPPLSLEFLAHCKDRILRTMWLITTQQHGNGMTWAGMQHVQRQVSKKAWEQVEYWLAGAAAEGERQQEPGRAAATLHQLCPAVRCLKLGK